jgi:hypothetical protein
MAHLRELQKSLVESQKAIHAEIKALGDRCVSHIKTRLAEEFPGISFNFRHLFEGGCNITSWDPVVHMYDVAGLQLLDDGRWFKPKRGEYPGSSGVMSLWSTEEVPEPFETARYLKVIAQISEELGVRIDPNLRTALAKPERVNTTADIMAWFPLCEILAQGKVGHIGWDIYDNYWIIEDAEEVIHVWWSENGHGFGVDNKLTKGATRDDLERFFRNIESNDTNKGQRERWTQVILKNWGLI